ncbi:hypothetical protein AABB24_030347 [Solanum stoloniferum]|uniref:Uncharacterized protein n=1 Tax=Solanum stoloniferum TaxID=62892 RepID=A0ABD2S3M1_9SOLN
MKGFHVVVLLAAGSGIRDTQCGFKMFARSAARKLFLNIRLKSQIHAVSKKGQQSDDSGGRDSTIRISDVPAAAFGSRAHLEEKALATRKWYRNFLMIGFHIVVVLAAGSGIRDTQNQQLCLPSRRKLRLYSEIPTDSELMELLHIELAGEERIAAHEFFMTLAACNTVIPILTHSSSLDEVHDTVGTIEYQGESPDEQALVAAASAYGYTLCERTSGHIVIDVNGWMSWDCMSLTVYAKECLWLSDSQVVL